MPQQHPSLPGARRAGALTAALASAALVVAGAVAPAAGAATASRTTLPSAVPGWTSGQHAAKDVGTAPGSRSLSLRVYLAGNNPVGMLTAAKNVSNPAGPGYAHYLTPAQFTQRYGTTAAQTAKVSGWLTGFGMTVTGIDAHYLSVTATVAEVQQAFSTSLHSFQWSAGASSPGVAPVSAISVPAAFGHDIATVIGLDVQPGAAMPAPKARTTATAGKAAAAKTDPAAQPCSQWWGQNSSAIPPVNGVASAIDQVCGYTPQQMRDAYGVTNSPYTGKGRTVAVVLDGALPTMEADADHFFAAHGVPGFTPGQYSENRSATFADTCGGDGSPDLPEEPLDVESIHLTAPDAKVVYVAADCDQRGGYGGGSLNFLDAETRIVDQHLADVSTDSFSTLESMTTPATAAAWELMFQQGALEGIGFNFDSGDAGDGSSGVWQGNPSSVLFPASDPWATGVGGTTLEIGKDGSVTDELGWGFDQAQLNPQGTGYLTPPPGQFQEGSTGGRSASFAQPWYQKASVPAALATDHGTAPAHREVPDVAADGDGASGWLIGFTTPGSPYQEVTEAGTSGAAPLVAGLEADAAQASGHAVGFANPLLYSLAGTPAIHDIVPAAAGRAPSVFEYQYDPYAPNGVVSYLDLLDQDGTLKTAPGYDDVTGVGSVTSGFVRSFARR
ncbi:S53 family peptidase [Kitasatospora mediocidica]|uniref:S53 family peptidase n=1 Tax=Kitasatospora mediocidica TaxID=58352 RepID=UPI00056393C6|nr:S53 family serine peptidase [Kitasatospora mediocidica]